MTKRLTPQYKKVVSYCAQKIIELDLNPALVAITGESGSGKSTFCQALRRYFDQRQVDYAFINNDDFLVSRADRNKMKKIFYQQGEFQGKSHWEIFENWYYQDRYQRAIQALLNGRKAQFSTYNHKTGRVDNQQKIVEPSSLIIVENPLHTDDFSLVIRFDVDRKEILKRKVERDADTREAEAVIEMHNNAQGYFWDRCKPENPDIIIDNTDYTQPTLIQV